MKRFSLVKTAALCAGLLMAVCSPAFADTPNIPIATPGVVVLPLHLSGQVGADVDDAVTIKLPFPAKVIGVSATARASGGGTPTLAIDVLDDGTTILSAPIAITAGTVTEGTVSAPYIADESLLSVDLDLDGTDPTFDDITITFTLVRR